MSSSRALFCSLLLVTLITAAVAATVPLPTTGCNFISTFSVGYTNFKSEGARLVAFDTCPNDMAFGVFKKFESSAANNKTATNYFVASYSLAERKGSAKPTVGPVYLTLGMPIALSHGFDSSFPSFAIVAQRSTTDAKLNFEIFNTETSASVGSIEHKDINPR